MKDNQKHLTLSQRIIIEQGLNEGLTFTAIAKKIHKDPSTVSKEVRRHRTLKERKNKHLPPRCKLERTCSVTGLCQNCHSKCNECNKCLSICKDYQPKSCGRTDKPPYVCNACRSLVSCHYFRYIYVAKYADDVYHEVLSSSREGTLTMNGKTVSEKVIRHIMSQEGLEVHHKRRRKYNSYKGEISPEVENLLERDFHAEGPNRKWLTDITEFSIPSGKIDLSPIIDCFDGSVPSWTIGTSPDANLVNSMLDNAIALLNKDEHPIVHSD